MITSGKHGVDLLQDEVGAVGPGDRRVGRLDPGGSELGLDVGSGHAAQGGDGLDGHDVGKVAVDGAGQ